MAIGLAAAPASGAVEVEDAACLFCGVADSEPFASGEDHEYRTSERTFTFVRCFDCGHVYLNPRPTLSSAGAIYPPTYYTLANSQPGAVMRLLNWLKDRVTSHRIANLVADVPQGGSVLEAGCGDGSLLRCMRHQRPDLNLVGVDLRVTDSNKAHLASLDIQVIEGPLETVDLSGPYDFVVMNQLIEHLWDAHGCMQRIVEVMNRGGRMSISTPDLDGYDRRAFARHHWGGYYFPRHLNLFTHESLGRLVKACGLEPTSYRALAAPLVWQFSLFNSLAQRRNPLRHLCKAWNLPLLFAVTALDLAIACCGGHTSNQQCLARKPEPPIGEGNHEHKS